MFSPVIIEVNFTHPDEIDYNFETVDLQSLHFDGL